MSRSMIVALLCLAVPALADKRRDQSRGYHNSFDDLTPEDLKAVRNFKLNAASADKLIEASKRVNAEVEKDKTLKDRKSNEGMNLDGFVKLTEAHPQIVRALKSAGVSPREFWVGSFAVGAAMLGAMVRRADPKEPLPPYANPDNVTFVLAHQEVLQRFKEAEGQHKEKPQDAPDSQPQDKDDEEQGNKEQGDKEK